MNEIIGRIRVNDEMHEVRWPTDMDDPDRRGGYAYCEIEAGLEYEIEAPDGMDTDDVLDAMLEHIVSEIARDRIAQNPEGGPRG